MSNPDLEKLYVERLRIKNPYEAIDQTKRAESLRSTLWLIVNMVWIADYEPHSADQLTDFFGSVFDELGDELDLKIDVPQLNLSTNEIAEIERVDINSGLDVRQPMIFYVPKEIASQENRGYLPLMHPHIGFHSTLIPGNDAKNVKDVSGWMVGESFKFPPLRGRDEEEWKAILEKDVRFGTPVLPTLNVYTVQALMYHLISSGDNLDGKQYYSYIPGTIMDEKPLLAAATPGEGIFVFNFHSKYRDYGFRLTSVIQ